MTTYDNQSNATGVIYTPTSSDWSLDVDGTYKVNISSLSLDPKVTTADQIVVIRQFDFDTIVSTPSPLLTGAETWEVWTLPKANSSGSTMYSLSGDGSSVTVNMSVTAADYLYQRTVGNTTTEIQLPVFDSSADTVYIMRKTQDLMNYINWTAGSRITASQLNHGLLQLLNISQELSVMQDNKNTLDPFVGKPGGICPLEADGTISNTYIGSATLSNTVGDGLEGDGSSTTPLKVDLAGTDGVESGLAFDGSGDLKADTIDNLTSSTEVYKPLSAKQGYTLDQKIAGLDSAFTYKGTIDIDAGAGQAAPSAVAGDTYDIIEGDGGTTTVTLSNFNNISATKGDIIRYNGSAWVEVDQAQVVRADGTVALNTAQVAVTQSAADSTTKVSTTAFVQQEITGTKLSELSDVETDTDDTGGNMIVWDTDSWEPLRLETVDYTKQVITTGSDLSAIDGVTLSGTPSTGQVLNVGGDGQWVNATVSNDSYVATVASSADAGGGADDSAAVYTAWNNANLGHGGIPTSSTLSYLEFAGAKHLMSATNNGAPAGTRLSFTAKQGITYRNGTLQFNEVTPFDGTWTTMLTTSGTTLNTTTLENDNDYPAEWGDYYIKVPTSGVPFMFEGALIRIGTNDALQSSIPLGCDKESTVKVRAGEMNVVQSVDRPTGRVRLKYPIKARIDDLEEIIIPTVSATAAYVDIVLDDPIPASADNDTIILERADGTKDTFTATTGTPAANEWVHSTATDTYGDNMAAEINSHPSWVAAYTTGTNTIRITQAIAGVTGNTAVGGTILAGDGVVGNPITPSLAGGTSPQISDQVFDNMVFEDLNTGFWELDTNSVAGTGSTSVTVTLPRDHGLANGVTFTGQMDSCNISGGVSGTPYYSDINTPIVYTAVVDTDTGSSNTLTATLNNSKTLDTGNFGGRNAQLHYGENNGIYLTYAKNITFRNCTFKGFGIAVWLKFCDNITFESCTFENGSNIPRPYYVNQLATGKRLRIDGGCRNITVKDCNFNNDNTAIHMTAGSSATYRAIYDLHIDNNKMDGFSFGLYQSANPATTLLIESKITNNTITLKSHNSRRNCRQLSREWRTNYAYGMYLAGWNLEIKNNNIGGVQAYVQEENEDAFDQVGYGRADDGGRDHPVGGPTFRNVLYEKKKVPVAFEGILVFIMGGGRRSFYNTYQGGLGASSPLTGKNVGPNGADSTWGALLYTPIGNWDTPSCSQIENNNIHSYFYAIAVYYRGGSSEAPEAIPSPRIIGNNIVCLRRGIFMVSGYNQTTCIENAIVRDNHIFNDHWSKIYEKVTSVESSDGTSDFDVEGSADGMLWIYAVKDGGTGGTNHHNCFVNLLVESNTVQCTSNVYKTYPMRVSGQSGLHSRYWQEQTHLRSNNFLGGYQSQLWSPTWNSTTQGNSHSRLDGGFHYNYADVDFAGAYFGSETSWAWWANRQNDDQQGTE